MEFQNQDSSSNNLIGVEQWGKQEWKSMRGMFRGLRIWLLTHGIYQTYQKSNQ